jgi:hypothetical protein
MRIKTLKHIKDDVFYISWESEDEQFNSNIKLDALLKIFSVDEILDIINGQIYAGFIS